MRGLGFLSSSRVSRFTIIGICNALISFSLLNLAYYKLNQSKIAASIISTSCAMLFSFIMNRIYVFSDKSKAIYEQFPIFLLVSLVGVIILNLVYIVSINLIEGHENVFINPFESLTGILLNKSFVSINLSTVFGAMAAMIWNYNGYKWFVFNNIKDKQAYE